MTTRSTRGVKSVRRRRRLVAAATGAALALTLQSVAFAEGLVGVNGTGGDADGTLVAVAGTGNASSSGGVAVAGGNANGGLAGVTVWGDSGATVSVDADRTTGTAKNALYDITEAADVYWHTGLNKTPTNYQLRLQTLYPPNPVDVADKAVEYARHIETTTTYLATNVLGPAAPSPDNLPSPPSGLPFSLPPLYDWTFGRFEVGKVRDGCGPAAAVAAYGNRGMPSQQTLAEAMGTEEGVGTDLDSGAAGIRKYYSGPSRPIVAPSDDPVDLMNKVVTSVSWWRQGMIIPGDWAYAHHPPNRHADHAVAAWGYWFPSAGWIYIWDPANMTT